MNKQEISSYDIATNFRVVLREVGPTPGGTGEHLELGVVVSISPCDTCVFWCANTDGTGGIASTQTFKYFWNLVDIPASSRTHRQAIASFLAMDEGHRHQSQGMRGLNYAFSQMVDKHQQAERLNVINNLEPEMWIAMRIKFQGRDSFFVPAKVTRVRRTRTGERTVFAQPQFRTGKQMKPKRVDDRDFGWPITAEQAEKWPPVQHCTDWTKTKSAIRLISTRCRCPL